jgi:hypothetical protein
MTIRAKKLAAKTVYKVTDEKVVSFPKEKRCHVWSDRRAAGAK